MKYCVYLTSYSGNKIPPFYIGSTSVEKIQEGYRGTVCSKRYRKIFQSELKEHPELFQTKIVCLCTTRHAALVKEEKFQRTLNVIKNPLYINLAYGTGIFGASMRGTENPFYGRTHSEESRQKIGEASKTRTITEETREKLRARPSWIKGKNNSENAKHLMKLAWEKRTPMKCPHCEKFSRSKGMLHRWHFDNCKLKPFDGRV